MTTTNAPAAALPVACLLPAEQADWDRNEWLESYEGETYPGSVVWAADDACLLSPADLLALFNVHHVRLAELAEQLDRLTAAGLPALDIRHAGQALAWLGY